jgi:hypothetical protein
MAPARRPLHDDVGAVAERRHRVGDRGRALAHREERVVVLRIADPDHVVGGQLHHVERGREPRALGDAARQQHERALVEDQRSLHARLLDRGERGFGVVRRRREDRAPDVERHAPALERFDQRELRRVAEPADLPALGNVEEASILGHDEVEDAVDVRADRLEIVEHPARHQKELAAGFAHAREHRRRIGGEPSLVGDGSVVVTGEHVHDHGLVRSLPSVAINLVARAGPVPESSCLK